MERKITRERSLPSFSIDVAQLESLLNKIIAQFSSCDWLKTSIIINLPTEELTFDNIDELKASVDLPNEITDFKLNIISNLDSISIYSNYSGKYKVTATSSDEVWCVGIVEMVLSTAMLNKRFYSMINKIDPFIAMNFVVVGIVIISLFDLIPSGYTVNLYAIIGLFLTISLMAYIKHKYLPSFVLRLNKPDNIFKQYSAEIMTISTAIIALCTIVIMIYPFFSPT